MLKQFFNALLKLKSRSVVLKRYGVSTEETTNAKVSPSNYYRNQQGPANVTIEGREFVISADSIETPFDPVLKRGDAIVDPDEGKFVISDIDPLYDVGGTIIGYRVRTQ